MTLSESCPEPAARELQTFYATFGQGDAFRKNRYVVVRAVDDLAAHEVMHAYYGRKWAFLYTEAEFEHQPVEYGLAMLPLGE